MDEKTAKPRQRPPRSHLSPAVRARIAERDGNRCVICLQTQGPLELDHIIPLRSGGTDEDDNLRLVCRAFNRGGRCPALTAPASRRKRPHRPTQPVDEDGTTTYPTCTVEVRISRQYTFHLLTLPGEPTPSQHRWLYQAIQRAQMAGYDTLTIVADETEYQLSLTPGEP